MRSQCMSNQEHSSFSVFSWLCKAQSEDSYWEEGMDMVCPYLDPDRMTTNERAACAMGFKQHMLRIALVFENFGYPFKETRQWPEDEWLRMVLGLSTLN